MTDPFSISPTAQKQFDFLSNCGREFVFAVQPIIRGLSDQDLNQLYLLAHTDWNLGEEVDLEVRVLMPIIETEWELRERIGQFADRHGMSVARAAKMIERKGIA